MELPNYVVDVHSANLFRMRFDKFWRCQDVVFDWKMESRPNRNRRPIVVCCLIVYSNLVKSYWRYGHRDRSVCVRHVIDYCYYY